jgi:crotonobetainyl-CoA:carnitine CoA-transferase CaiB-like acyl-CoA transferase
MLSDAHWSKFCAALSLPEGSDDTLATVRRRRKHHPRVDETVSAAIRAHSFDAAAQLLKAPGFGYTEVTAPAAVLDEPQAQQPGKLKTVPVGGLQFDVPQFPLPNQLGNPDSELPPPLLGEHTPEIMRSLGYDESECATLRERGTVVVSGQDGPGWASVR